MYGQPGVLSSTKVHRRRQIQVHGEKTVLSSSVSGLEINQVS